jgi:catechol 2,3-dioxygenase-like lactoylglutathione lyase family enzyme
MSSNETLRPGRLHHHAFVSRNQEATRRFYEDIICLAFFQFADAAITERQAALASTSPFDHVALTATPEIHEAITQRARAAGIDTMLVDHGYCRSLYLRDPDGLIVELTVDDPRATAEAPRRRASARADLARWLAGDHRPNNELRSANQDGG